jgi:hypothetical protein
MSEHDELVKKLRSDYEFRRGMVAHRYREGVSRLTVEAADMIEQQARDLVSAQVCCDSYAAENQRLSDEAEAAKRDLAAMMEDNAEQAKLAKEACETAAQYRADAERYRWLRSSARATKGDFDIHYVCLRLVPITCVDPDVIQLGAHSSGLLDKAIDDIRAKKQEG